MFLLFLAFQANGGPGLAPPQNMTAHWSQGVASDPAPRVSRRLQRRQGHPLSLALRGRRGCSCFKLLSRKWTCTEVASDLLRQSRTRCTPHKDKNSHNSNCVDALGVLCGSFSCSVRPFARTVDSSARSLTRRRVAEGEISTYMWPVSLGKWSDQVHGQQILSQHAPPAQKTVAGPAGSVP